MIDRAVFFVNFKCISDSELAIYLLTHSSSINPYYRIDYRCQPERTFLIPISFSERPNSRSGRPASTTVLLAIDTYLHSRDIIWAAPTTLGFSTQASSLLRRTAPPITTSNGVILPLPASTWYCAFLIAPLTQWHKPIIQSAPFASSNFYFAFGANGIFLQVQLQFFGSLILHRLWFGTLSFKLPGRY